MSDMTASTSNRMAATQSTMAIVRLLPTSSPAMTFLTSTRVATSFASVMTVCSLICLPVSASMKTRFTARFSCFSSAMGDLSLERVRYGSVSLPQ